MISEPCDFIDDISIFSIPNCWTNPLDSCKITNRVIVRRDSWRSKLANIKSQIKRNKQNEKRRLRNRVYVGRARTFVKKARMAIASNDPQKAEEATRLAISALDKAAEKGTIHKNNAARRKSRLMKRLAELKGQIP